MVSEMLGDNDCCRLAFHASSVGSRKLSGLAFGLTLYPGAGRSPLEGGAGRQLFAALQAGGPLVRLNTVDRWPPVWFTAWLARTGRFWVTTCPKIDPKTPRSKLRP